MILFLADIHAGSTAAPWPDISLPEGSIWRGGKTQRWLNRCWREMVSELPRLDAVVFLGDAIDGTHPRNAGLVTNRLDYQERAAVELLSPIRDKTERFYMVAGTSWHVGEGAQHESQVAEQLDAVVHPETKGRVWPFVMLRVGDDCLHCAHHIGFTSNVMYEPNALWRALVNLRTELQKAYGKLAPDVTGVVRAHRHRAISVRKGNWQAFSIPSWQLKTDHAHKVAVESMPEIGYVLWDGTPRTRTFRLPSMHVETL